MEWSEQIALIVSIEQMSLKLKFAWKSYKTCYLWSKISKIFINQIKLLTSKINVNKKMKLKYKIWISRVYLPEAKKEQYMMQ